MTTIFTDSGQTLDDFKKIVYVHCPRCQQFAQVRRLSADDELKMFAKLQKRILPE